VDYDINKLRRALQELLALRQRLRAAFAERLVYHVQYIDGEAIEEAYHGLTEDQQQLIDIALETGFRVGNPKSETGVFIFIAYASEDSAVATEICAALEDGGIRCFLAERDIKHGTDWNDTIVIALEQCAALIVLVSGASITSDYVKSEVQGGFDFKKEIFPVLLPGAGRAELIDNRLRTRMQMKWSGEASLGGLAERLKHFRTNASRTAGD
jgi:hypothetical protein